MASEKRLRAIIIDDELNARENLSLLLQEFCPQIEVVALADGVEHGRKSIETLKPDVVFLDIRMPSGAEGFELLKQMENQQFLVVFVTAFRDYAIEAFHANAVHYILKPVDIEELTKAVQKVVDQSAHYQKSPENYYKYHRDLEAIMTQLSLSQQRIPIHHSRGIKLVRPADIEFISADGNCSLIQLGDGMRFLDTRTLKVYSNLLPEKSFLRVHRSYIVNIHQVDELMRSEGVWLRMRGGQKIPVSRNRLADFMKAIDPA